MHFKASTDYGLRAILYMAAHGVTCSSKDIAEDMAVPRDYLIQLAQLMRNSGLIEAKPGKHGGYKLAKDPTEITLLEVMNALESEKRAGRVRKEYGQGDMMVENILKTYSLIEESFDAYLDSITIDMMLLNAVEPDKRQPTLGERLKEEGTRLLQAAE